MSSEVELVEDALAAWRITHLIVADALPPVAKLRDRILDTLGPDHPVSYLITCPACTGVWVGAAVAVARFAMPRAWRPVARGLAAAAAAPLLESAYNRMGGS